MKSALFIHRSVGHNLIHDGELYKRVAAARIKLSLSDYDQNTDTFTDSFGKQRQCGFEFPGGNTRPEDLAQIFRTNVAQKYKPIRDLALEHDVIILKSCYPNSNIKTADQLEKIKAYYRAIAEYFSQCPQKQLILLTSPPLTPLMTTPARAKRARQLANWMSTTKLGNNVAVFDFFDVLADSRMNWLRRAYRRWLPVDSHPNVKASRIITPLFVDFLARTIH